MISTDEIDFIDLAKDLIGAGSKSVASVLDVLPADFLTFQDTLVNVEFFVTKDAISLSSMGVKTELVQNIELIPGSR
jgi:hypothetical protein